MSALTEMIQLINRQSRENEQLKTWVYEAILLLPEDQQEAFMKPRGIMLPPQLSGQPESAKAAEPIIGEPVAKADKPPVKAGA